MWEKIRKLLKLEKEETTEERIAREVAEAPLTLEKYPELREKYEQDVIDGGETLAAIELAHRAYILERTRTDPEFAKEIKRQEEAARQAHQQLLARKELEDLRNAAAERRAASRPGAVHCPYCHSAQTERISGMKRVGSVVMLGIASTKIGKQWHCTKCGSDF